MNYRGLGGDPRNQGCSPHYLNRTWGEGHDHDGGNPPIIGGESPLFHGLSSEGGDHGETSDTCLTITLNILGLPFCLQSKFLV